MAGDWIKMRCNLGTDPDVIEIASLTGVDEFGVMGRLHAVWSWLDQHSTDGTNVRISSAFLNRITTCPGFVDAMRAVGWLEGQDGALNFPGYCEHNGESAKRRASESRRKNIQRKQHKSRDIYPDANGTNVPDKSGPEKRREDTSSKEEVGRDASVIEVLALAGMDGTATPPRRDPKGEAEQIYAVYPRKIAKPDALRAIEKQLRKHPFEFLLGCTKRYAASRVGQDANYTPHPATWFNQERFSDDPAVPPRSAVALNEAPRRPRIKVGKEDPLPPDDWKVFVEENPCYAKYDWKTFGDLKPGARDEFHMFYGNRLRQQGVIPW